jgi:molecular chaperone GrpE
MVNKDKKEAFQEYQELSESLDSSDEKLVGSKVDTAEFGIKGNSESDEISNSIFSEENFENNNEILSEDLVAKISEEKEKYLRLQAEFDNFRKRSFTELSNASKFAIESFAESLLPVSDSLEIALSTSEQSEEDFRSGVELTLKQLHQAFDRSKLVKIDPECNEKFDPNKHQAVSTQSGKDIKPEVSSGNIINVLQKGYFISNRVIRPALVVVAE